MTIVLRRTQNLTGAELQTERVLAMKNRPHFVSEPSSFVDHSVFAPPETNLWGEAS